MCDRLLGGADKRSKTQKRHLFFFNFKLAVGWQFF
jgi:hypothetical protein